MVRGGGGGLTVTTREVARDGVRYAAITLHGGWNARGAAAADGGPGSLPLARFVLDAGGLIEPAHTNGALPGVTLLLPAASAPAAAAPSAASTSPLPGGKPSVVAGSSPTRILVVDDEPYALEALDELLRDLGYAVTACDGPVSAMEALVADRFDLLLTDVIMPGISRVELAAEASRRDPDIRIVLMSGYLPDDVDRPEEWQFLRKPLELAKLAIVLAGTGIEAAQATAPSGQEQPIEG